MPLSRDLSHPGDYERARTLLEAELLVLQSTRPSSGSAQHHHHMTPATVGGSGNAMTEMDQHVAHYTHLLATIHAKLQNEALARGYYASACRKLEAFYGVHHGYAKNCVKEQTAFLTQIGETFEAATVKKQALVRRLSDSKNAKTGDRAKSGKASKSRGRSRSGKASGVSGSQASPPNDFVAAKDRMEALAGEYGGADAMYVRCRVWLCVCVAAMAVCVCVCVAAMAVCVAAMAVCVWLLWLCV